MRRIYVDSSILVYDRYNYRWLLNNAASLAFVGLTATLAVLYYQQKEILRVEKLPEIEISSRSLDGDDLEVVLSVFEGVAMIIIRYVTHLRVSRLLRDS